MIPEFTSSPHPTVPASTIGILLTNIGSPDAPTPAALRRYLAEFLGDRRVIEFPRWVWLPILYLFVLTFRPRRSARLYRNIWTDNGSPLIAIMQRQAAAIEARLRAETGQRIAVTIGMAYGNPSMAAALAELKAAGVRRVLVMPLFAQYSATTTAASLDAVFRALANERWLPEIRTVNHFHDHPGYIQALVNSIREHWAKAGQPERLLFSYHGIPEDYFNAGDPYYCECEKTSRLVAEALELPREQWMVSFQSRFGPQTWLKPYTDKTLEAWGHEGLKRLDVICPGFSADCLETLDEIGREGREEYEGAGGEGYAYIPALNDRPDHIAALTDILMQHLQGWLDDAPRAEISAACPHVTAHQQHMQGWAKRFAQEQPQ